MGVVEDGERRAGDRRTMAIRGPGAGGFTPAHSVAASNPCLNCGTNVQLAYCPECGQREIDADPTLREFLHELAEELLHWDGKLGRTLRLLVRRPGALTREYLDGRRVRYISPLRLYLACSVLFFSLEALAPRAMGVDRRGQAVERGIVQIGNSTEAELAAMSADAQHGNPVRRYFLSHLADALRTPAQLQHATTASLPRSMFVLVPLYAALIALVYRDRRRRYPQHLAFVLHVHAALFLALTLLLATRFTTLAPRLASVMNLVIVAALGAYLVRATQVVYESSVRQASIRIALASALYFAAFVAVVAAVFAMTVLLY
ncbi:hypothetical protein BH11GEM2_BH11GEM2_19740 [soil metagenome]